MQLQQELLPTWTDCRNILKSSLCYMRGRFFCFALCLAPSLDFHSGQSNGRVCGHQPVLNKVNPSPWLCHCVSDATNTLFSPPFLPFRRRCDRSRRTNEKPSRSYKRCVGVNFYRPFPRSLARITCTATPKGDGNTKRGRPSER